MQGEAAATTAMRCISICMLNGQMKNCCHTCVDSGCPTPSDEKEGVKRETARIGKRAVNLLSRSRRLLWQRTRCCGDTPLLFHFPFCLSFESLFGNVKEDSLEQASPRLRSPRFGSPSARSRNGKLDAALGGSLGIMIRASLL